MLATADTLNLSTEYTMFSQDNLTCYWGNRQELTAKQRETINMGHTIILIIENMSGEKKKSWCD